MGEPEDVITDAGEYAAEAALGLWRRHSGDGDERVVRLEEVKRRLELFMGATFGRKVPLVVAEARRVPNVLKRWFLEIPGYMVVRRALPETDGQRVKLPERLSYEGGRREEAMARYRVYAVEQMMRVLRGTVRAVPEDEREPKRALYVLAEAVAVEHRMSETLPGMVGDVARERRHALEQRPAEGEMRKGEWRVEQMYRRVLGAEPGESVSGVPVCETPEESLAWARKQARWIDEERFRGVAPVEVWGRVATELVPGPGVEEHRGTEEHGEGEQRSQELERRPKAREPEEEDDDKQGSFFVPQDDLHESAQDPMGLQRPVDKDDGADPEELAESLAEMPEGRLVRTDDQAREVLSSGDPPPRSFSQVLSEGVDGVSYPEWDYRSGEYEPEKAVVRPRETKLGPESWVEEVLRERSRLVHEVRRCFERLRPRRERLKRQPDGPEIDVPAYVEAYGDRMAGRAAEQRLYQKIRPRRREVAIELLVDISASTDSWVKDDKRVIDVEKVALMMVCEALEALGDRYSITAFSGRGPKEVMTWRLKEYEEEYRQQVKRRIAALTPKRYTRTGAAIRHATVQLEEQSVRKPLLLVLSDGKPNDLDEYERRYGVEDTRQAVHEARLQGINVFCLTVDHDAPSYMPRIFGESSFGVLRQPGLLPRVLVDVVRRLVNRSG